MFLTSLSTLQLLWIVGFEARKIGVKMLEEEMQLLFKVDWSESRYILL